MSPRNLVLLVLGGLGLLILAKPDIFANQSVVPPETPTQMPNPNPLFTLQGSGANQPLGGLATVNWALGKDGLFTDSTSYGEGLAAVASDVLKFVQGTPISGPPTVPSLQQIPSFVASGARIPLVIQDPPQVIPPSTPGLPPNLPIPVAGYTGGSGIRTGTAQRLM